MFQKSESKTIHFGGVIFVVCLCVISTERLLYEVAIICIQRQPEVPEAAAVEVSSLSRFFPSSFISSDGLDFELSSPGRSLCHDGCGSALSSSAPKLHGSWDKGIPWSDVVSRPRLSHHQCLNKQQQQNSACVSNYTTHYSLHRRWPPFRFERLCAIPYKVYTDYRRTTIRRFSASSSRI